MIEEILFGICGAVWVAIIFVCINKIKQRFDGNVLNEIERVQEQTMQERAVEEQAEEEAERQEARRARAIYKTSIIKGIVKTEKEKDTKNKKNRYNFINEKEETEN